MECSTRVFTGHQTERKFMSLYRYVERIANVRWELKDLGMEHNGYIDVLLGEYKQFSTKLAHGSLDKEVSHSSCCKESHCVGRPYFSPY
jgi:hypothetical protein